MSDSEEIAKTIQAAIEGDATEFSKKISYLVGNATLKSLNFKEEIAEKVVCGGATLQSCYSIGSTAWKTVEDISRGDKVCAGLCILATTCEGVAITASSFKGLPFRYKIYLGAKGISIAVMRFRNLCRNAQGQIGPC